MGGVNLDFARLPPSANDILGQPAIFSQSPLPESPLPPALERLRTGTEYPFGTFIFFLVIGSITV